ncbi:MAG: homoserine dehydrogenase [Lachnospiraceae bacterium]|nr:homoserine dehydrogenase [Lachnospiraceae bacterium]
MINIAVLGYGTVGSGVVEVVETNKKQLNKKTQQELNVKYILDLREFPGDPYENKIVHDVDIIMNDPDVQIVCETMGGTGAAYKFTKAALEAGKSVCTSNKAMVAAHGTEMLEIAKKNNCNYMFEASVGGGIPIIRPLQTSLCHEYVEEIAGILNGTTNFMLTKMEREGADYADVLKEAQRLGYAEQDPTADVEGHDTCRKISILSSLMLGKTVNFEKVYTEGISKVTADDFAYAAAAGYTIKLLGTAKALEAAYDDEARAAGKPEISAKVSSYMVPVTHPIALVNDVMNGVFVTGNMVGETMYYGSGAGKLPTASAVVADIAECAKHIGENIEVFWNAEEAKIADYLETETAFYVRTTADASDAVFEQFPDAMNIIVDGRDDAAFVLPVMKEREFAAFAEKLGDKLLGRLRIYA